MTKKSNEPRSTVPELEKLWKERGFNRGRFPVEDRENLTGYWWEHIEIRSNQSPLTYKGKDFHDMTEEEYYDSLDP
jgi:hypothetical protein